MFKRVEKRRRKREEEDALGLDEELKQVLGMNDTDSEESDSSDDSSDDEGSLGVVQNSDVDADGDQLDGDDEGQFSDAEGDDEEGEDGPFSFKFTIAQALREPICFDPTAPSLKLCIVCTQKRLKTEALVDIHRNSNAHKRRYKLFLRLVKEEEADPEEDAFPFVQEHLDPKRPEFVQPAPEGEKSKRALKKEANQALRKAKRAAAKEKARAKKAAKPAEDKASAEPTKKPKSKKALKGDAPEKSAAVENKRRPKKKRRVEKPEAEPAPSTASELTKKPKRSNPVAEPSTSPKKPKKSLQTSEAEPTLEVVSTGETSEPKPEATVVSIAKSAHDRAKAARSKALLASKGHKSKASPKRKFRA